MNNRLKSRKFLMALSAQITGILVMVFGDFDPGLEQSVGTAAALLLMALSGASYMKNQGAIDAIDCQESHKNCRQMADIEQSNKKGGQQYVGSRGPGQSNVIVLVCLLFMGGCVSGVPVGPTKLYVDTVGKKWLQYVEADPDLSAVEKTTYRVFHKEYKSLVDDVRGEVGHGK